MPLPDSQLSPGDHIRVDRRTFTKNVYVKVALDLLGYDPGLWRGLTDFSGLVIDRYYQPVTGSPMFSIDFGRSIGQHEVKVCHTKVDKDQEGNAFPQRALFGSNSVSPVRSCATNGDGQDNVLGEYDTRTCTLRIVRSATS
jgi:hypothetical protein